METFDQYYERVCNTLSEARGTELFVDLVVGSKQFDTFTIEHSSSATPRDYDNAFVLRGVLLNETDKCSDVEDPLILNDDLLQTIRKLFTHDEDCPAILYRDYIYWYDNDAKALFVVATKANGLTYGHFETLMSEQIFPDTCSAMRLAYRKLI